MTAAKKKIPLYAGPFQLRDLIGSGGFGEVWYGVREEPYFQEVAVKIPRQDRRTEDSLQRFEAERQAMALLNHSNVIRFFEGGTLENGDPFYAMEFVDGLSITEFCDSEELSIDERVALFVEACDGVAFVHEHGILHRDIKPANLIVNEVSGDPTVKLIDFGIARCSEFDEMGLVVGQTLDGASLGTRDYSSPEQIDGKHSELDETSDVFSLGAVLCELLCSVKPLDDKTLSESSISQIVNRLTEGASIHPGERFADLDLEAKVVAAKKRGGNVAWLDEVLNGDLGKIVSRAIAADPDKRYPTATELADDLRRYLAGEPIDAVEVPDRKERRLQLNQKAIWLTAALVAVIGIGCWAVFFESPSAVTPDVSELEVVEGASKLENNEVQAMIQLCRERLSRAQLCWENDDTEECIDEIRLVNADISAGKLDLFSGRFSVQRRNIQCQAKIMLIFCLLETGQVAEAKQLLNEVVPLYREKVQFHAENEGRLENVWKSSLAALITLNGDAERLGGNTGEAVALYSEAIQIVDGLVAYSSDKSAGLRGWGLHMGLPHGRLADVMVRPDSLVVSTAKRTEWMVVPGESRSPMKLYEVERTILNRFSASQKNSLVWKIAFSLLKESLPWNDLGESEKADECQKLAGRLSEDPDSMSSKKGWRGFYEQLDASGGGDQQPGLNLNRVQYQLLETEQWMLEATNSLAHEDTSKAHEYFTVAQKIADRLAKNCPEAPEFLHYSAQIKLRIADQLCVIPDDKVIVTQLRSRASEALTSLQKLNAENAHWNQSMEYADIKTAGLGRR